jgi:hypothetical protein
MKGILFTPQMALAACAERKTQTRRVMVPQPPADVESFHATHDGGFRAHDQYGPINGSSYWHPDYMVGERRCLLTTWAVNPTFDTLKPTELAQFAFLPRTEADVIFWHAGKGPKPAGFGKSRPGRFLPDTLRPRFMPLFDITAVRAERVQDITDEDVMAEGIAPIEHCGTTFWRNYLFETAHPRRGVTIEEKKHRIRGLVDPRHSFESLWDSINADRKDKKGKLLPYSWAHNPWVWAITIRRVNHG